VMSGKIRSTPSRSRILRLRVPFTARTTSAGGRCPQFHGRHARTVAAGIAGATSRLLRSLRAAAARRKGASASGRELRPEMSVRKLGRSSPSDSEEHDHGESRQSEYLNDHHRYSTNQHVRHSHGRTGGSRSKQTTTSSVQAIVPLQRK
jgi:hypothetical protein